MTAATAAELGGTLQRLLLAASTEAVAQRQTEIFPRTLFAAVFDLAFGAATLASHALPVGYTARAVIASVAPNSNLAAYLAALIESDTDRVGKQLHANGLTVEVGATGDTDELVMQRVRNALAPEIDGPLDHSGLVAVRDTTLATSAAHSFDAAANQLSTLGIDVAVISGHRSHAEQREDYEVISSIVSDRRNFPVGKPGTSMHERGLAVDLAWPGSVHDFRTDTPSETFRTVQRVMRVHGWYQFDPFNDPVHFSFGRIS